MGVTMSGASWTDERVKTLKELWNKGHSAAEIARELGGVTRNTVIGKLHRIGLRREEGDTSKAKAVAGKPKPGTNRSQAPPQKTAEPEQSSSERNFWTREEENVLIELRNEGKPFPVITSELSKRFPNRTKPFVVATVTAKYYYLVKVGRAKAADARVRPVSKADINSVDFTQVHRTADDFARAERVAVLEAESRARPVHRRLSIMDLTQTTCHWPIGDPNDADFHFCGMPAGKRRNGKPSSYCSSHTELAYNPHEYRTRQRSRS